MTVYYTKNGKMKIILDNKDLKELNITAESFFALKQNNGKFLLKLYYFAKNFTGGQNKVKCVDCKIYKTVNGKIILLYTPANAITKKEYYFNSVTDFLNAVNAIHKSCKNVKSRAYFNGLQYKIEIFGGGIKADALTEFSANKKTARNFNLITGNNAIEEIGKYL